MASLLLEHCDVCLNLGCEGAEALDAELQKLFPQSATEGECELRISGDSYEEKVYFHVHYGDDSKHLMMITIDGLENIDALRRHCEMVLDHHDSFRKR